MTEPEHLLEVKTPGFLPGQEVGSECFSTASGDKRPALALGLVQLSAIFPSRLKGERGKRKTRMSLSKQGLSSGRRAVSVA